MDNKKTLENENLEDVQGGVNCNVTSDIVIRTVDIASDQIVADQVASDQVASNQVTSDFITKDNLKNKINLKAPVSKTKSPM